MNEVLNINNVRGYLDKETGTVCVLSIDLNKQKYYVMDLEAYHVVSLIACCSFMKVQRNRMLALLNILSKKKQKKSQLFVLSSCLYLVLFLEQFSSAYRALEIITNC